MIAVYISFCENNKDKMHEKAVLMRDSVLSSLLPTYTPEKITVINEGKPVLKDFPLCFSISHSGGGVAFAVGGDFLSPPPLDGAITYEISHIPAEIGVDIESISREINFRSVMKGIFSPSEISYVGESKEKFIEIFTRKESLCKLTGNGLREMDNFDTFNLPPSIIIENYHVNGGENSFSVSISYKKQ